MAELARICVDRGYARLEWWVLDWNTPAIDFYRSLGARAMDEWTVTGSPAPTSSGSPVSRSTTWHSAQRRREATPVMSRPPSVAAIG